MSKQRVKQTSSCTRAEYAVHQVRSYIFSNGLKPGDQLPGEYELARHLKVSRPTVREAIKGLSLSGLLESRPRTGTRVSQFAFERVVEAIVDHFYLSELDLTEILEARASLEMAALPMVLQRATPEQIGNMRAIEARFEDAISDGGRPDALAAAVREDLLLHEAMMRATGNRLLANMTGLLRAFFSHPKHKTQILERHFDAAEQQLTAEEHRKLIHAIAMRDATVAGTVLNEHFQRQFVWLHEKQPD
jgi:DNA-binding FadR family transcriptional regulator